MATLTPVDFDPFGEGPAPFVQGSEGAPRSEVPRINVGSANIKLTPVDDDPFAGPGVVEDVAKSFGSGVVRGAAQIAGVGELPLQAMEASLSALEKNGFKIDRKALVESMPAWLRRFHETPAAPIGSKEIMGAIDQATGLPITSREPQTTAGKIARTAGEFVPGAVMGPGGVVRNVVTQGILPGVASEAAGLATEGTSLEPWARAGAAIATGVGGAALTRPRSVQQAIKSGMPEGLPPQVIDDAQRLIDDAAARGVNLTWPEAIEQVAPGLGSGLLSQQRLLESSRQTSGELAPTFAQRPAQIEQAARAEFDQVAPRPTAPSTTGPAAGREAEGVVNDVRDIINRRTEPFYQRAGQVRLTPQEMVQVRALPGYEEARAAVRGDPQLNRYVRNLPDNSVGFLNEVKKYLDVAAENAAAPVNQQRNMQRAAGYSQDARQARQIGIDATPDYEVALNAQEQTRRQYLEPLLQGPLGRLADRDITTRKAIDALFPKGALPGSEDEVAAAVRAIAQRSPGAARDLVRAHVESVFDKATRNLQAGPNQWGGGSFVSALTGNAQEAANLRAAVRALPNGDQIWTGFNRFIEIAQATGARQRIGSRTAFNAEDLKALSEGRITSEVGKVAVAPQRLLTTLGDAWGRWQLGRNLDELSHILTDPNSGNLLRAIASRPAGGREALSIAARLSWNTVQEARKDRGKSVP